LSVIVEQNGIAEHLIDPFIQARGLRAQVRVTIPLFDSHSSHGSQEQLEEGAVLLRGFLVEEVGRIAQASAFRHMVTPGGYTMSVGMTNCGRLGWVSDRTGSRFDRLHKRDASRNDPTIMRTLLQ
jgi:alkylated DNA repair dioxygenase AlkB